MVDFFLSYLAQFYEIVVFTTGLPHNADPVISKLDPFNYITYRLYRDSAKYVDGVYVKDLECLNRDLSRIVVLDTRKEEIEQKDNLVLLRPWTGEPGDQELLKVLDFLESMSLFLILLIVSRFFLGL